MGLTFLFFVLPNAFTQPKNIRDNQKRKPSGKHRNPYPRVGLKPWQTLFFGFPEHCCCFLWFSFVFLVFPNDFCFLKTFGKTKKTKHTKNKPISKGGPETFKHFVVCVFPNVCFFCFLWFYLICLVFPHIFWFSKNLLENTKNQTRPNPYPRVGLKPWKTWCFLVFPKVFPKVFFCFCCFPKCCWVFLKNLRENKQNKQYQIHIQGWVWHLKTLCFAGFPKGFCWFLCYVGFPGCFLFSKNLREN